MEATRTGGGTQLFGASAKEGDSLRGEKKKEKKRNVGQFRVA